MFVVGNKQISYAHIAMVEWLDAPIAAKHPRSGAPVYAYGFNVHTSYNHVEQMLYDTEENRKEAWEALIESMEAGGF
jgi:hypothetical protein